MSTVELRRWPILLVLRMIVLVPVLQHSVVLSVIEERLVSELAVVVVAGVELVDVELVFELVAVVEVELVAVVVVELAGVGLV